ncbi:hypothetical protein [Flavobacterium terrigena]|uniref:Uncharacterized protein n=1 Tax=Flavobacterium terrigena TaxID=402734 RepID=A0A1H6SU20_9FLAO|nr:hypothetical protein [Flavobacterium terrigena]SEI71251.1 hypothetical protein SAMN05660918_1505 [Flavobacterium terrigena]
MIQKNLNEYPLEYQSQILKEILFLEFPFELQDMIDYESNIDFKVLSKNHQVHWSIEILEHYRNKWDWNAIQTNPFVYSYCNIGLFFKELVNVKPIKCRCKLRLEYCNKDQLCTPNYNYILLRPTNINPLHEKFTNWVKFLIEEKFFNKTSIGIFFLYDTVIDDVNNYDELQLPAEKNDYVDNDFDEDEVPF